MVFCSECGKKINKGENFCTSCGAKVENVNVKNDNVKKENVVVQKSGLRTASIVLGIIGIVFSLMVVLSPIAFILSVVGLILGICAVKRVRNVAGILLNSIGLFLSIIMVILFVLVFMFIAEDMVTSYDQINDDGVYDLIVGNDDVASFNGDTITKDELYEEMRNYNSYNILITMIDKCILEKMYPKDDKMMDEVNDTAKYYYDTYESYYGYTKEEFLSAYGYSSEEVFIDYLILDHRRKLYYEDYVKNIITEDEIREYYTDKYSDGSSIDIVREEIIDALVEEKMSSDESLYEEALINMREEANLKIYDEYLLDKYNEYKNSK